MTANESLADLAAKIRAVADRIDLEKSAPERDEYQEPVELTFLRAFSSLKTLSVLANAQGINYADYSTTMEATI
jgi:hypothetical protein